ncbi:DNA-binding transcriptional LysR family regulator [Paenibacillus rhizosphaerae]|uniref:DNA-binding transcriptional LysR family regulator n=1 Tax=Paenibacillus rhizosphaerae TaxID=297318 RepID=A0A839TUS3_9BACL|nr:LysR family transcriptional regulator [Paenibacillus rhizosphaerae]MBB3130585.1 DNA-binding transcriptional LysR family regulator [Paenibacillus rhizosphaerae]
MELTDLKVFMAIVKEGSITRAAEKLGYVQSNLTTRVRKLESGLGVQLFLRTPKGVVPTEKGLVLYQYASDILMLAEEAAKAVKEPDHPCGPLSIGVVETIASTAPFIQALSEFQSQYPEVSLSLVTATSKENYEKVLDRRLDGAFLTGEFDLSLLQIAFEIQEEVVLLAPAGLGTEAFIDKTGNPAWVVFPKGCPLRAANEDWLHSKEEQSMNMIEVSTLETMVNCVRAGIGSAFLTRMAVAAITDEDGVSMYPVPERYQFVNTRLVSRKEQFQSQAFLAFAACVNKAGQRFYGRDIQTSERKGNLRV